MRNLGIFLILVLSLTAIAAQDRGNAKQLDVYEIKRGDKQELVAKTHAFVDAIKGSPIGTKGVIQIYPSWNLGDCMTRGATSDLTTEALVKDALSVHADFDPSKILVVNGLTNFGKVHFWSVPEGSSMPEIIEGCVMRPCCCADVFIIGSPRAKPTAKNLRYKLSFSPEFIQAGITWTVVGGRITSGQGKLEISVDATGGDFVEVSASFPINPACGCPDSARLVTKIER